MCVTFSVFWLVATPFTIIQNQTDGHFFSNKITIDDYFVHAFYAFLSKDLPTVNGLISK